MKRLSFLILFASLFVASLTLVSCGDDNNEDMNDAQNAIAAQYVGTYSSTDNLNVSMAMGGISIGDYTSANAVSYRITSNSDGSINVTIPAETYANTQIGDINVGSYTIDSLKYILIPGTSIQGYYRAYKGINAKVNFSATGNEHLIFNGQEMVFRPLSGEYSFTQDVCVISVTRSTAGVIQVKNVYSLGRAPVLITNSFTGTKQ